MEPGGGVVGDGHIVKDDVLYGSSGCLIVMFVILCFVAMLKPGRGC